MSFSDTPERDKNQSVFRLLEIIKSQIRQIQELKDEIARLKNRPGRPKLRPSKIGQSKRKLSFPRKKGKGDGAKKIEIHNVVKLKPCPEEIPEGAVFLRYKDYSDIEFKTNNTRYRRAVYRLPDGTLLTAKLPNGVCSHFGSKLKQHIIYLSYKGCMTQPLILEYVKEHGVQISSAQISRILIEGHDAFHQEKEAVLKKGIEVSKYVVADGTGCRHKGKNGYCTHIGNEYFAYFRSSHSKSRLNFLKILCTDGEFYHLNGYTFG